MSQVVYNSDRTHTLEEQLRINVTITIQNEEWMDLHDQFFTRHGRSWTKSEEQAEVRGAGYEKAVALLQLGECQFAGSLVTVVADA